MVIYDCIGVQNGDVHITADLATTLFRASTRGAAYRCNWFLDALFDMIAFVRFYVSASQLPIDPIHRLEHPFGERPSISRSLLIEKNTGNI